MNQNQGPGRLTGSTGDASGNLPDYFDAKLGQLEGGLPGVTKTSAKTIRYVPPFGIGGSVMVNIQTFRQEGQLHDDVLPDQKRRMPAEFTTFVQVVTGDKAQRFVLTDDVVAVLLRQVDSLTSQAQRAAAKRAAATRKARGFVPTFTKGKGKGKRKGAK